MSTSKDVPRLANSSGTAPIPTNPEMYHQKSYPGLPANPRLAYPTAQSASVHRERSVFLSSADLTETCGNAPSTVSSQSQAQWPRQTSSSYPNNGASQGENTSSCSWDRHSGFFLLVLNVFHYKSGISAETQANVLDIVLFLNMVACTCFRRELNVAVEVAEHVYAISKI